MGKTINLDERQKFSISNKYIYYAGGMPINRDEAERITYNNDRLLDRFKSGRISEDVYTANTVPITYKNKETGEESPSFTSHDAFKKLDPLKNIVFNESRCEWNIQNALLEALLFCLKLNENIWNKGTTLWFWSASDLRRFLYIDDGRSITWHLEEILKKINDAFKDTIKEYEEIEMLDNIIGKCQNVFGLSKRTEEMTEENRTDYDDEGSRATLLRNIADAQRFIIETYKYLDMECAGRVLCNEYCDKTSLRGVTAELFVLADKAQSCFDELSRAFCRTMEILPEKTEYRIREDESWAQANKELEERDKEKTEIEEQ